MDRKQRLEDSVLASKLVVTGVGLYALFQSVIFTIATIVIPCDKAKFVLTFPAISEYLLVVLVIVSFSILHYRRHFTMHIVSCCLFAAVKIGVLVYLSISGSRSLGECFLTHKLRLFIYLVGGAEIALSLGLIFLVRRVRRKNLQIVKKNLAYKRQYQDQ